MNPEVAPQISTRLAQMVSQGCVISTSGLNGQWLIADATFLAPHCLWYFLAFGTSNKDEHHLEFHRLDDDGLYLNFYGADGSILATIAPVEFREHREALAAWLALLATVDGRHIATSIAELKSQAATARE